MNVTASSFSRAFIPGDREVEPFRLCGSERLAATVLYYWVLFSGLGALVYVTYLNPLLAVVILLLGYCIDQFLFVYGHLEFHTEFIEIPESKMNVLCHHSFIHHYRNVRVFHETWLETRLSYFIDTKFVLGPKNLAKVFLVSSVILALAFFISPLLAAAWFAGLTVPKMMQSSIHEWYHNPIPDRKTFYSRPAFWFFTALEKTGLASTHRHTIHHRHGLKNLAEVDNWLDLYVPFGERLGDFLWQEAHKRYVPGKTRMNDFVAGLVPLNVLLNGHVLVTASIFACYGLLH